MTSGISDLIHLIETLRGDKGCPWDRKQTPQSMAVYLVEEVYELVEAIESGSIADICEELGDVLFQLLFIVSLYGASGDFTLADVTKKIREKMIHRHPHVFGDASVETAGEVKEQWRRIKAMEHPEDRRKPSVLDSVPRKLPALMRAYRISDRAAGCGFDWDDIGGVIEKTEEEWAEFKTELEKEKKSGKNKLMLEFGDIVFTLVNVARFARIHPETALSASTKKFEKRFRFMEKELRKKNLRLDNVPRDQLERLWGEAKKALG
ncbi:MAG: nucleoside triphosphate pyrophosphohydrolase [Desulfobacterales bacterium]